MIMDQFLEGIFQETELDFHDNTGFKGDLWDYFEGEE